MICGVGIGKTKTLAKLASHCAKQPKWLSQTNGVAVLDTETKIDWALSRVELNSIWGVGSKTANKLNDLGITNGLQLKQLDINYVKGFWCSASKDGSRAKWS